MTLTPLDRQAVSTFWERVADTAEDIGTDAVARMLAVYPQTKTYFSHWKDLGVNSPNVRKHGKTVMSGVADAVKNINNLVNALLPLSERHVFTLRVDPANFKILSHNILVALAIMYPNDFTPQVHMVMDKFLAALARALSEKYR